MPNERKPGDSTTPLPRARKEDPEDVSWALSTASATWARGDRSDALKWLRRAAEAASEAEQDGRALELAKAAAEIAAIVEKIKSIPPPLPSRSSRPAPMMPPIPPSVPVPRVVPLAPDTAPPRPVAVLRDSVSPTRPSNRPPLGAAHRPSQPPLARDASKITAPVSTLVSRGNDPQKGSKAPSERPPSRRPSERRRRSSKPAGGEIAAPPRTSSSEDIESWPTQTLEDHELTAMADEMTRIGSPAYVEGAKTASSVPEALPSRHLSQAMRVIVWRAADGVHVAPYGTTVAAITMDALLVAIDPGTDLTTWLTDK